VVVVTVVVTPAMVIVMTVLPFMTFALIVSSTLLPPAFARSGYTHGPETRVRPDRYQKQQNQ
jgi:hypothetical protein